MLELEHEEINEVMKDINSENKIKQEYAAEKEQPESRKNE